MTLKGFDADCPILGAFTSVNSHSQRCLVDNTLVYKAYKGVSAV